VALCVVGFIAFRIANALFFSQIKDTNGPENKELAVITDAEIEATAYNAKTLMSKFIGNGDSSGIDDNRYSDWDYSSTVIGAGKFSGVGIANAYKGSGKEVTFEIKSEVRSGNFKIVITDQNHKILYTVPIDSTETVTFTAEENKLYFVKLVGESAEISVEINRTVTE
jgi:hypothetical protein